MTDVSGAVERKNSGRNLPSCSNSCSVENENYFVVTLGFQLFKSRY